MLPNVVEQSATVRLKDLSTLSAEVALGRKNPWINGVLLSTRTWKEDEDAHEEDRERVKDRKLMSEDDEGQRWGWRRGGSVGGWERVRGRIGRL